MVRTIPASQVTDSMIFVDFAGRHMIAAVREVRGQVAAQIDGIWTYFNQSDMVNIFVA
jgi:hypothetical protein